MYKAYLCISGHMSVLWQRVIKNCATKCKTSYRLLTVDPKLPLHCYV